MPSLSPGQIPGKQERPANGYDSSGRGFQQYGYLILGSGFTASLQLPWRSRLRGSNLTNMSFIPGLRNVKEPCSPSSRNGSVAMVLRIRSERPRTRSIARHARLSPNASSGLLVGIDKLHATDQDHRRQHAAKDSNRNKCPSSRHGWHDPERAAGLHGRRRAWWPAETTPFARAQERATLVWKSSTH
jgi:hypothetical protein